jgi:hypothetical protein
MSIKKDPNPRRARMVVSIGAGLLFLLAALAGVMGARHKSTSPVAALPEVVKTAPAAPTQRRRPIADFESELITITPHGFEPRELTRPPGQFLLLIDNRSDLAATLLSLTREAGPRTHEMHVPREEPNWSEVVDLQPGNYVLTEANHPRWECRITITAR